MFIIVEMKTKLLLLPVVVISILGFHYGLQKKNSESISSILLSDTIPANVYYFCAPGWEGRPLSMLDCDSWTEGVGIEDVIISIIDLSDTSNIYIDTSQNDGLFDAVLPDSGYIKYFANLPERFNDNPLSSPCFGLTPFDLSVFQQILNDTEHQNCPYAKIAADFDYSGVIDSSDLNLMSDVLAQCVGGNSDSIYNFPSWQLLPRLISTNTILHPDPFFINDYWNKTEDSILSKRFPMEAELTLNHIDYEYLDSCSWNDEVKKWEVSSIVNNCDLFNYGFWLIKKGNVSGCIGGGDFQLMIDGQTTNADSPNVLEKSDLIVDNKSIKSANENEIHIKLKSNLKVEFLMVDIFLNKNKFELNTINANPDLDLKGSSVVLDGDSVVSKGRIASFWYSNFENNSQLNCDNEYYLLSVKYESIDSSFNSPQAIDFQFGEMLEVGGGNRIYGKDEYEVIIEVN